MFRTCTRSIYQRSETSRESAQSMAIFDSLTEFSSLTPISNFCLQSCEHRRPDRACGGPRCRGGRGLARRRPAQAGARHRRRRRVRRASLPSVGGLDEKMAHWKGLRTLKNRCSIRNSEHVLEMLCNSIEEMPIMLHLSQLRQNSVKISAKHNRTKRQLSNLQKSASIQPRSSPLKFAKS